MTNANGFHGLEVFGLQLHFAACGRGNGFHGAAWRGLLGQSLFRSVCPHPSPACVACPSIMACAYPAVFKPVADTALPPFWLHDWQRGHNVWSLGIRWLGTDNHFAIGEWLTALASDTELSFGGATVRLGHTTTPAKSSVAWRKDRGWLTQPAPLVLTGSMPDQQACQVRFITPLISKHAGDPLFGALYTRLQRLVQQYGNHAELARPTVPWRCRVIAGKEKRIPLAKRVLTGTEWELELTEINKDAWPLLRAGSELHAGGQTGLGCGHYEIIPAMKLD